LMSDHSQLVVFRLDNQRYAMLLTAVERIVRAVEVMPLPKAPAIVLGVIDVGGRILPVLNIRRRLGLPDKEIGPADQFLIARTARRALVLVIDEAEGMITRSPAEIVAPAGIVPGLEQIHGVIKLDDGMALIYDLDKFLSLEEAEALEATMSQEAAHEA
jgi:purine-binding chemotaxis protein CheW